MDIQAMTKRPLLEALRRVHRIVAKLEHALLNRISEMDPIQLPPPARKQKKRHELGRPGCFATHEACSDCRSCQLEEECYDATP